MSTNNPIDTREEAVLEAIKLLPRKFQPYIIMLILIVVGSVLMNFNVGNIVEKKFAQEKYRIEIQSGESKTALQGLIDNNIKQNEHISSLIKSNEKVLDINAQLVKENDQLRKRIEYLENKK